MKDLQGKKVAMLMTDGFEHSEAMRPKKALEDANADVDVISLQSGEIKGWKDGEWHDTCPVDKTVSECSASDYDALVLPGGVISPDKLRQDKNAVNFVKDFFKQNKPVSAICHGPWLLAEADVLDGREVTSYGSIRTDLENAGAKWVDREVVVDAGLTTSRDPGDLDAFIDKTIEEIAEGKHSKQSASV